jgi:hypothetical protein
MQTGTRLGSDCLWVADLERMGRNLNLLFGRRKDSLVLPTSTPLDTVRKGPHHPPAPRFANMDSHHFMPIKAGKTTQLSMASSPAKNCLSTHSCPTGRGPLLGPSKHNPPFELQQTRQLPLPDPQHLPDPLNLPLQLHPPLCFIALAIRLCLLLPICHALSQRRIKLHFIRWAS